MRSQAEIAFDKQALANAANVTAVRVKQFLESPYGGDARHALTQWVIMRGLTPFDLEAMWAHMVGNPRPIVIAPEPERVDSNFELGPGGDEDEAEELVDNSYHIQGVDGLDYFGGRA